MNHITWTVSHEPYHMDRTGRRTIEMK